MQIKISITFFLFLSVSLQAFASADSELARAEKNLLELKVKKEQLQRSYPHGETETTQAYRMRFKRVNDERMKVRVIAEQQRVEKQKALEEQKRIIELAIIAQSERIERIKENARLESVKEKNRQLTDRKSAAEKTTDNKKTDKKATITKTKEVISAPAPLYARIDLSRQRMKVYQNNTLIYEWKISTARKGYVTPVGSYKPYYTARMHYSRKYENSPMPNSVFFKGGYAIHGTDSIWRLGTRASHGCVRLHPTNAKTLYTLIQKYGLKNTAIKITN